MFALVNYITINIDPVLIKLGPFSLRWYGLMYVLGIAVGLAIVLPYARRRGVSSDQVWNIFWGVAIAALIGGRLYYVLQNNPGDYLKHPGDIFAFWQGGMAFFGALFLGIPVLLILAHQQKVPLGIALDCVAIFAPLAQAVGRIGNIINGDVVGYQSTLPWSTIYKNSNSFAPLNVPLQPAGAYELLFSVGLFLVLWPLRFRLRPAGMLFVLYLSIYCVGQFILFIWRDIDIVALNLKQAQITAIVVQALLVIASYVIVLRPWLFDPAYAAAGEYDVESDEQLDEADGSDRDDGGAVGDEEADGAQTPGARVTNNSNQPSADPSATP
jgi:phosphatidylglycerol:prolipoprotein diacylglycerol transferase